MIFLKIEFWIDYNNPICYKQHQVLEAFLEKNPIEDLELLYRNYEMIPQFEPCESCTFYDLMSQHYVESIDDVKKMYPNLESHFRPVSVHDAHRLSHLAKKEECAFLYHKLLFDAYYEKHQNISAHDVLTHIAIKSGLNIQKINDVLTSDMYADQVKLNRENAIMKGIFELPHIRIDGKIKLSGFHNESELFLNIKLLSQAPKKHEHCEDGNCERKKTR